ncbi:uncharacterized protein LOC135125964 [Zophobas morio]|uniref:uncharacterized protein LOC135125964 n=1 Tax=Zophobas morio TaxID=2755281 RepID=UPI003082854C
MSQPASPSGAVQASISPKNDEEAVTVTLTKTEFTALKLIQQNSVSNNSLRKMIGQKKNSERKKGGGEKVGPVCTEAEQRDVEGSRGRGSNRGRGYRGRGRWRGRGNSRNEGRRDIYGNSEGYRGRNKGRSGYRGMLRGQQSRNEVSVYGNTVNVTVHNHH